MNRILIAGGGPAGLTAAISLRQAGVAEVRVAERARPGSVLGSELMLQSAALRALDRIGVAEDCARAGAVLEYARNFTANGELLAETTPPRVTRVELPAAVGISRPALHGALSAAAERAGARIEHERSLAGIEQRGAEVVARFEDGEQWSCDLLIGADGVNSKVRALQFPEAPRPSYIGQVAWRARVPRLGRAGIEVYFAADSKTGIITVSDTEAYLFHLHPEADYKPIARERFPELLRARLASFGGAVAEVRDHIVDPAQVHYAPLTPVLVPPPWHSGRVLLIGDAAHATTPHLAYGAGLAMEDGVFLGEEIGRGAALEAAIASFVARRWERCRMVVENGAQIARWEIAPDPGNDPVQLMRDTMKALTEAA